MGKPRTFQDRRGGGGNRGGKRFSKFSKDNDGDKEKLGRLPEETMAYYRQVSATVEAGFDDDDPSVKRNFLDNVFNALKDEGVKVSQNQTVSRILEALFPHSESSHLRVLFCVFCKQLKMISSDRFASHVLQSLIQNLPAIYDDADLEQDDKLSLKADMEKLCEYCLSEMSQILTDTYGSHVLRALLETLGGVVVKEEVIRSHVSRNQRKDSDLIPKLPVSQNLSADFKSQFEAIKNKINKICNYKDHLTDPNFCPVIQTLLLILHKSNTTEYDQLATTIMEKACPPTPPDADKEDVAKNLPVIVQNGVGSYLIELLVGLTSETDITTLYKTLFKGKLIYFSVHPVANYVLQKLCSCITNTKILQKIVTELSPYLEDILAVNHIGVITRLAEACRKDKTQQESFTRAVMKAFHCNEPESRKVKIAPLILAMQTYDTFFPPPKENDEDGKGDGVGSDKPSLSLLKSVNIHGSLLLQQMLYFDRPKGIVTSLLSLSPAELSNVASDQCGSHVVEAFFKSSTVWDRNKEEFLKKLKGFYVPVACTKNGSRCLEGVWKECALKMKILIAEELIKSRERIESDRFGYFLHHNFALLKFSTRKKEWMDFQSGVKKKQKMLDAILKGGDIDSKKNRKRKENDGKSTRTDLDYDDSTENRGNDSQAVLKEETVESSIEKDSKKEKKKNKSKFRNKRRKTT